MKPQKFIINRGTSRELSLRTEIANYLYQSRGVICNPEQIVVGSGTEQLLPMILRLLG